MIKYSLHPKNQAVSELSRFLSLTDNQLIDRHMRGFRKCCQRGSNLDSFLVFFVVVVVFLLLFLYDMIQTSLLAGHHQPSSEMPFKCNLLNCSHMS